MTPAESLARTIAVEAHAGKPPTWHVIGQGLAYIDPGTVDCCGVHVEALPDDDMIVHDWRGAPATQRCSKTARRELAEEER